MAPRLQLWQSYWYRLKRHYFQTTLRKWTVVQRSRLPLEELCVRGEPWPCSWFESWGPGGKEMKSNSSYCESRSWDSIPFWAIKGYSEWGADSRKPPWPLRWNIQLSFPKRVISQSSLSDTATTEFNTTRAGHWLRMRFAKAVTG